MILNNFKLDIFHIMNIKKKILITCALPYANGELHIGHILEHVQADICVRYHRMQGHDVYFISADDTHGTPIMLKAKKNQISPSKMIFKIHRHHKQDLLRFNICYDKYHVTHGKENYRLCILIYKILKKKKLIISKEITQLYDVKTNMFLSDRLVQGTCPRCFTTKQFGDNCSSCGAIYSPIELIDPKSILSNSIPVEKKSKHLFFNIPYFEKFLKNWINSGVITSEIINKIQEWFKSGLQPWNISRDAPYFGFKIPLMLEKYFYVWFDAPIGYLSTFRILCKEKNNKFLFQNFWNINSKYLVYQFIGKDIIYFHSLFWPSILHGINFRKPTKLFVHGHVTFYGKKISKSNGMLVTVKNYLKYFNSDCLRYYYATKISAYINDIDFNFTEFMHKINSDIINKIINLASRSASFIHKYFHDSLSKNIENIQIYSKFINAETNISKYYREQNIKLVIHEVIKLSNLANHYLNDKAPWNLTDIKKDDDYLHEISSMGINMFYIIMIYLKPILPDLAKKSEIFLNKKLRWNDISKPLTLHRINKFQPLLSRITQEQINSILKEFTEK
ncbi:MAG: methionine--tRNA ligase [Wigglesworthia glossinidia]|nr:methionine--tRNA ligase [Wigglesworthia glossinidia]